MGRQTSMKPKRYEDYRNQMKLTRKSEEHRHRRNQQMAEAQRLLEQNCISESPSKFPFEQEEFTSHVNGDHLSSSSIVNHDSPANTNQQKVRGAEDGRTVENTKEWSEAHMRLSQPDKYSSNEIILNESETAPISSKPKDYDRSVFESSRAPSEHMKPADCPKIDRQLKNRRNRDVIQNSNEVKRPSTSECPKIKQIKERMLRRKRIRREEMMKQKDILLIPRHQRREDHDTTTIHKIEQWPEKMTDEGNNLRGHGQGSRNVVASGNFPDDYHSRYDDDDGDCTKSVIQMLDDHKEAVEEESNRRRGRNRQPQKNAGSIGPQDSDNSEFSTSTDTNSQDEREPVDISPSPTNGNKFESGHGGEDDDDDGEASVVDIELIYCQHCKKSYAPATYKKFCQTLDENGNPKCIAMRNKKRKVYNSAKVRITGNSNLTTDEQRVVIASRKKVVADLRGKAAGKKRTKKRKVWRQQSDDFRKAMETNRLIAKAEKEGKPAHYYL